ncbi:uncharacterized protein DUF922 [Winogradskyella wandonensis]|uniref:Uncharacterized protein DUF922 n=1 Tax=Winogradskyella wandonensis TaxID=1442586 RepID=A0A4R1KUD4_9FLAO|nr:DUF922 domain-containing protein [Winogradskyella wandonensis]TCK68774.1 uncharacterized protein DUF922 [Winogradskyella wandonensis]
MSRLFLIFLCVSMFSFAQKEDLEHFSWEEDKPLVWSDFKGKPNKNSGAAAQTASGISFGFSISKTGSRITKFKADVACLFYPTESWVKNEDATAHILRHEQFHFNITELHARKFRQEITKLKASAQIKTQLNNLYQAMRKASYDMQRRYDKETNHSIDKEQQKAWEIYVSKELKRLEAFKTK